MNKNKDSIDLLKKIRIREVLKPYLDDKSYLKMKKDLTSAQKVSKWKGFQDFDQKLDMQEKFFQIQKITEVPEEDFIKIQLESLMLNKADEVTRLFSPISYQKLFFRLLQNGKISQEEIPFQNEETQTQIYQKIIKSKEYVNWRKKYFPTMAAQNFNEEERHQEMEVQSNQNQRQVNQRQHLTGMKQQCNMLQNGNNNEKKKGQRRVFITRQLSFDDIENKKTLLKEILRKNKESQNILQVKLISYLLKALQNKKNQYVYLSEISKIIQKEERMTEQIKRFIVYTLQEGDQQLAVRLDGSIGYQKIKSIYQLILPIDIFELNQRCQLSKISQQVDNGCFVVGNTGAGKTTFTQSLLGYRHEKVKQSSGKTKLCIQSELKQIHQKLIAGQSSESITTNLTTVVFNHKNKSIYMIDTPGFEDTHGPLNDIANQVMLQIAYQRFKHTTYVILTDLNKLQVNRIQGAKKLALSIANRFKYKDLDELQRFVLLIFNNKFNRLSQKQIHNIRSLTKKLEIEQQFSKNQHNKIALKHLINSLYSDNNFFDPFKSGRISAIKDKIASLQYTLKKEMKIETANQSKTCLKQVLNILKTNIKKYNQTAQFDKSVFYYNQLNILSQNLPNQCSKAKQEVDLEMKKPYLNQEAQIQLKFNKIVNESNFSDIEIYDIDFHLKNLRKICKFAKVNKEIPSENQMQNNFNERSQKFKQQFLQKINKRASDQLIQNLPIFVFKFAVKNEKSCNNLVSSIQQKCSQKIKSFKKYFNNFIEQQEVTKNDIDFYNQNLEQYLIFQKIYRNFEKHQAAGKKIFNRGKFEVKANFQSRLINKVIQMSKSIEEKLTSLLKGFNTKIQHIKAEIKQINIANQKLAVFYQCKQFGDVKTNKIQLEIKSNTANLVKIYEEQIAQKNMVINQHLLFQNDLKKDSEHVTNIIMNLVIFEQNNRIEAIKLSISTEVQRIKGKLIKEIDEVILFLNTFCSQIKKREIFLKWNQVDNYQLEAKYQFLKQFSQFKDQNNLQQFKKIMAEAQELLEEINIQTTKKLGVQLDKISQTEFKKILQSIKLLKSYAPIDKTMKYKYNIINTRMNQNLQKYLQYLENFLNTMKLQNYEQFQNHFNIKLAERIQKFIKVIFIGCKNENFELNQASKNHFSSIYSKVKEMLSEVMKIIQLSNEIDFTSNTINNNKKIKKQDAQRTKGFHKTNFISSICKIYTSMIQYYSTSQFQIYFQGNKQEDSIKISEFFSLFQSTYRYHYENIELASCKLGKNDLRLLENLIFECRQWFKFQKLVAKYKDTNMKIVSKMSEQINILVAQKNSCQKKLQERIQNLTDKDNKIKHFTQIKPVLDILLQNYKQDKGGETQQLIQLFFKKVNLHLAQAQKQLKKQILPDQQTDMPYFQTFQEIIDLHQALFGSFEKYKVNDFQEEVYPFYNIIKNASKKIQIYLQSEIRKITHTLQQQLNVQSCQLKMIRLQQQREIFFKVLQVQKCYPNNVIELLSNSKKGQIESFLSKLQTDIEAQNSRKKQLLKDPHSSDNLCFLKTFYNTLNKPQKDIINKKLNEQFNKRLNDYSKMEFDYDKKYYQILTLIDQYPQQVHDSMQTKLELKRNEKNTRFDEIKGQILGLIKDASSSRIHIVMEMGNLSQQHSKFAITQVQKLVNNVMSQLKSNKNLSLNLELIQKQIGFTNQMKSKQNKVANKGLFQQIISQFVKIQNAFMSYLKQQYFSQKRYIENQLKKPTQQVTLYQEKLKQFLSIKKITIESKWKNQTCKQESQILQKQIFIFIKNIIFQFQKYCPIKEFLQDTYCQKKIQETKINQIRLKIERYHKIYTIYFKDHQMMDIQDDSLATARKKELLQINQQISIQQKALEKFQRYLVLRLKNTKRELSNFDFQQQELMNDQNLVAMQKYIEKMLFLIEDLGQFSKIFKDKKEQINIEESKKKLKDKLTSFIHNVLSGFDETLQKVGLKHSKKVTYMLQLLTVIYDKQISFLYTEKKMESSMFLQNQKISFFQAVKEEIKSKLKSMLAKLQSQKKLLILFYQRDNAQFLAQKHLKEVEANRKINTIRAQKQKNQDLIMNNAQKTTAQKEILLSENDNSFQVQIKNVEQTLSRQMGTLQKANQQKKANVLTNYCSLLISLQKFQLSLGKFLEQKVRQVKKIIQEQLKQMKKLKIMLEVSKFLQTFEDSSIYVSYLKSNVGTLFNFETILQFNQKTKAQDINYVLKNLYNMSKTIGKSSSDKFIEQIKEDYKFYKIQFDQILYQYKTKATSIQNIIESIKINDRINSLATIMAVWCIKVNQTYNEDNICEILPHPLQIVTMLIMTSKNKQNNSLYSKLAQVKTGEGKSIILAALAINYAKLGYKVSVACYSPYLTQRDFKQFQPLFNLFGVSNKVTYGTFNQVLQNIFVNQQGNLRQIITQYLSEANEKVNVGEKPPSNYFKKLAQTIKNQFNKIGQKITEVFKKESQPILLIDQVDVFFQYCGLLFRPISKINHLCIQTLIQTIWKKTKQNPSLKSSIIFNTEEFKKCVQKFPKLQKIIKNHVQFMIEIAHSKEAENPYEFDEGVIKYKEKGSLTEKKHFGYDTIFAYCRQNAKRKINQEKYKENLFIPLKVGQFAYSQLPKKYLFIQGLSGTISFLSEGNYKILDESYKISSSNIYLLPSIYGLESKRQIKYYINNGTNFQALICSQILKQKQKKRPVLVCFQNYSKLKQFEQSQQFKNLGYTYTYIHQKLSNSRRDEAIREAGFKDTLTLMTSSYARGTDFVIKDRFVKNNGGLHLIMAYLPQNLSEYEQLKGRTGRQGQRGSIDANINTVQLHDKALSLKIQVNLPNKQEEVQQCLKNFWNQSNRLEMEKKTENMKEALKCHEKSITCLKEFSQNQREDLFLDYIYTLNALPVKQKKDYKILIGIDGTGSMATVFANLISQLVKILQRINELKNDLKVQSTFKVQIAIYRNYNSGKLIFELSKQQIEANKLVAFLKKVKVDGGWGEEALQVLYHYINTKKDGEESIDMLILIGDAQPHCQSSIKARREDKMWKQYKADPSYKNTWFEEVKDHLQQRNNFCKGMVINGLAIYSGDSSTSINQHKKFQNYLKQLTNEFNGETGIVEHDELIKKGKKQTMTHFIVTKITCLLGDLKNKSLVDELYRQRYASQSAGYV